jgi:hypothetical protein
MKDLFQFGTYSVRQATARDHAVLRAWIAEDPDHAAKRIEPEFFIEEEPGVGCYLLSDAQGPLFFFRTSNVVRLDTQFGPAETKGNRDRNRDGLIAGMDWAAALCARRGATEILFESKAPLLRRLAIHQMGCEAMPGELVRSLEPERCHVTFGDAMHVVQQGGK